jgi:ABC-2 type transport system permease protein
MSVPSTSTTHALRPTPSAGAAPLSRVILAQTRAELTMAWRQRERLLITLIVPPFLLLFFGSLKIIPTIGRHKPIDFLLPGILSLAVISTGMVSLGIATAYERYYGVLKRLGSSPLPRWGLILAKVLAVLAIEVGQVVLLILLAIVLCGWRPHGSLVVTLLALLLGTLAFASLGMLMAGALRAEATLAGANGLYLLFLLIGGSVLPISHLPKLIQPLVSILPPAALSDGLRGGLGAQAVSSGSLLLLTVWGFALLLAAALNFKWE